jgi:hypothetical protein
LLRPPQSLKFNESDVFFHFYHFSHCFHWDANETNAKNEKPPEGVNLTSIIIY